MQALTAYLCCKGADDAIRFYGDVFGATVEGEVWRDGTGRVGHSELVVGGSNFYLSDEHPELDVLSPLSRGGATSALVLVVDDLDATWSRALAAGATVDRPISEANGGRSGWLRDPWGHRWNVWQAS